MADINKPDLTNLWASDGAVIPPSPSKIKTGWVAEIPPHQWENFVQNRQDVALAYLLQKGVPEWDEKTEYIANKSFVQFGGDIYKCIQTNTGENPSSKPAYWKPLREVYSEELGLGSAASADVVQSTGDSEDDVMSQKAVTDALDTRVKWVSGDKIITVADSGADFTTVMGAIAEAMKWRSIDGSVIVEIQSGYLVQEQLFFVDNDYSHINIKSQNGATIIVDPNSMSVTDFEGSGYSGFILCARGKSPMFQAQFEFLTRPANTISGATAIFDGEIYFGNLSGVKGAGGDGSTARQGGSITMGDNNNFSGAGGNGSSVGRGGLITIGSNNDFSGAGNDGVANFQGGSIIVGNNNNFSGAERFGAFSSQGGLITIGSNNDFSGAGDFGVSGEAGASITMGSGNDFSGAGKGGVYGFRGGSVTMGSGNDFSRVSSGYYSFSVSDGGLIQAGTGTIFTEGRERSQARGTITTSGLIMG